MEADWIYLRQRLTQWVSFSLKKALVLFGVLLLTFFLFYRFTFINFSPWLAVFSLLLFLAELHTVFHLYGLFYSIWPRHYKKYTSLNLNRNYKINIFICVCGEPEEIVRETIVAAKKAAEVYKKIIKPFTPPRVLVLNDGFVAKKDNWKEIQLLAEKLGVEHIARIKPGGFKAGNINNGLRLTKTNDSFNTLDIVLDADFSVKNNFLLEITKPFKDGSVDFAQSPQRYKNETTWVAKAAAAHQIFFFDHICAAKGEDNALFLCGTNFAIRRKALNSVNGINTKFITEDYATSLDLHLKGKKGVFIPKVIAEGIAPSTLKAYFSQQQRWGKGSFDVTRNYLTKILFGPLTLRQRFHYLLSATYYLIGIRDFILMLAPLPYLLFGTSLIKANTLEFLMLIYAPFITYNFILYLILFRHPIKSLVLDISSFPIFVSAFFSSLLKKELSFIVTIKKYEKENPFEVYKLQLAVILILVAALTVGLSRPMGQGGALLNYFWAIFNVTVLSLGFYLVLRENLNTSWIEKAYFGSLRAAGNIISMPLAVLPKTIYAIIIVGVFTYVLIQLNLTTTFASLDPVQQVVYMVRPVAKQELLVPTEGVYYGYYQTNLNTHPLEPMTELVYGEKTSLAMFYQDWSRGALFDVKFAQRLSKGNRVPVLTWEPWDSTRPLSEQSEFSLQSIVKGKHDLFLHSWAKSAAAYQKPFFLRFAHEMNGNWYPWGNQPQHYITAWRHVHNVFENEKADNVIWLWSPNNTDVTGSYENLLSFYPGDYYVDWVGFSGFNWGTSSKYSRWISFKDLSYKAYEKLSTLNKPIMVTETSSVSQGGDKQAWFRQTLQKDIPELPNIKAVILFDQNFNNSDFSLYSGQNYSLIAQDSIINNKYYLKDPIIQVKK